MKRIMKSYLLLFAVFMLCADIASSQTPAAGEIIVYYGKDNGAALSNPLMGWQFILLAKIILLLARDVFRTKLLTGDIQNASTVYFTLKK
jgi:hypothetical protein